MKATGSDLLPINDRIFRRPDASQATPGMFHDLDVPSQLRLDPPGEAFLFVAAIGPDQLQTRKGPSERRKQGFAATVVLDIGRMDQHMQDQASRIDQDVALAPLDLFAPIVAASPPFCVVFTD